MKKSILLFCISLIFISFFNKGIAQQSSIFRHIVIITFKQDASADSIKILDDLYQTLSKGSMVKDYETGVSMSMRDSGIVKHVYVTSFSSKDDMDNYRKQPTYSSLFKVSLPISEDVTVADYWAKK